MELRHLGVRVILVRSFARIHDKPEETRNVGAFANKDDYEKILEDDIIDIVGLNSFAWDVR
jgi:aconitate hydratase